MRISLRSVALRGLTLAGLLLATVAVRAADPVEKALPPSTFAFLKVDDAAKLRQAFNGSQAGQLLADPAMKPLKDRFTQLIDEPSQQLKQVVGVTIPELLELPQGQVAIAFVARDNKEMPFSLLITADAGENADKMNDVLTRATQEAEKSGNAKVATEDFQGTPLHIVSGPKNGDAETNLIWAKQGSVFSLASDQAALKDLLSHAKGRDASLASSELYGEILSRVGKDAQVLWYLDITQAIALGTQAASENGANAEQIAAQMQILGLNNLKALGGSFSFSVGNFDSVGKIFLYAPGPSTGLLKIFQMPATDLKPQPWVPASAASYQSISWDLDGAWTAINELVDQFAPGVMDQVAKSLAGPNGDGLDLKRDVFDPLGDRITIISDFKKPITDKSQRLLLGVALEDAQAFQTTLNKIFDLAKASPKKRTFQGSTIYDFDVPAEFSESSGISGPISLTIAKDTLFVSSEPSLLEQVLRPGGPSLADSPDFQQLNQFYPTQASTFSYQKPEEQARAAYSMFKSGQLQEALKQASANDPNAPDFDKLLDPELLPEFEVFEKYLAPGGGFAVMTQDGVMFTQFTSRKKQP